MRPPGLADTVCPRPPTTVTVDRLTNWYAVASKVGNLHSKFGHARPLRSGIVRYVREGRTDRRTDRRKTLPPSPTVGGITVKNLLRHTVGRDGENARLEDVRLRRRTRMGICGTNWTDYGWKMRDSVIGNSTMATHCQSNTERVHDSTNNSNDNLHKQRRDAEK